GALVESGALAALSRNSVCANLARSAWICALAILRRLVSRAARDISTRRPFASRVFRRASEGQAVPLTLLSVGSRVRPSANRRVSHMSGRGVNRSVSAMARIVLGGLLGVAALGCGAERDGQ